MADNIYAIVPNFPVGVLMSQLKGEMNGVWPADVFPITMIHRGRPGPGGVLTTGNITIVTQRVLTAPEDATALAFFPTHVPIIGAQGGILIADLPAGTYQGEMVYVSDASRIGVGSGVVCYWDGTDRTWRVVATDNVVAVIP